MCSKSLPIEHLLFGNISWASELTRIDSKTNVYGRACLERIQHTMQQTMRDNRRGPDRAYVAPKDLASLCGIRPSNGVLYAGRRVHTRKQLALSASRRD